MPSAHITQAYIVSPAALPPPEDAATASSDRQGGDTSGRGRSVLPAAVWAWEAFFEVRALPRSA